MTKVFYYYYYIFYSKFPMDGEPYLTARLALTASETLFLISIVNILSAYLFCKRLNKYEMAVIALLILAANTFYYLKPQKVAEVIRSQPKFFGSDKLSIVITWIFFLVTTSAMFWLDNVVKSIISNCTK